jgi:hypothetical protein
MSSTASSQHRFRERLISACHHIEIGRHKGTIGMNGGRRPSDENGGISCRRLIGRKRSAKPAKRFYIVLWKRQ